jgi:hypothetical protein
MVARRLLLAGILAQFLGGCMHSRVTARPRPLPPPADESRVGAREPRRADPVSVSAPGPRGSESRSDVKRAIEAASALVGQRDIVVAGVDYGDDCAALVRAAFDRAGRPLPATARDPASIHALASVRGLLRPGSRATAGDVVFLAERPGGPPAHVGIVERVDDGGRAIVLHRVARGVMRLRVSLTQPGQTTDATGKRLNDVLVIGSTPVSAGSLVVAFASFF